MSFTMKSNIGIE